MKLDVSGNTENVFQQEADLGHLRSVYWAVVEWSLFSMLSSELLT